MEYKIGVNSGALVYISTIISAIFTSEFYRWPVSYTGIDGQQHGDGLPIAKLTFPWISQAELNVLRGYVTTGGVYYPSKACAIKIRTDDGTFATFDCIMHWPDDLASKRMLTDYYPSVIIDFSRLVEVV